MLRTPALRFVCWATVARPIEPAPSPLVLCFLASCLSVGWLFLHGLSTSYLPFLRPRLVRYWPVLVCFCCAFGRFSYLLLFLQAAPLCAIGPSCCVPPLSSAWPLAILQLSSFFGPRLDALLASPAAFLTCPRHGLWPLLLSLAASPGRASVRFAPVVLRSSFVLGVALGHISLLLLRTVPLLLACPAAFLLCPRCGFWPFLLSLAASSGHASERRWPVVRSSFVLFVAFGHIITLLLLRVARHALLASPAAFLLCSRRGLWPYYNSSLLHSSLVLGMAFGHYSCPSLLLRAAPPCALRLVLGVALGHINLLLDLTAPLSLASPAAFLLCRRRGLWPFLPSLAAS